jgi:DNA ligase D-like protein (predicted 3'-phosphoesterase)
MSQQIQFGDHPFAVKEHRASKLHWDLRLHCFGRLLLSFALKKSPHLNPHQPLKAVRTPDHDAEYLRSERIIPPGFPGAGEIVNWDYGFFRVLGMESMTLQLSRGNLGIHLVGRRLKGNFSLKWIGPGEHDWLWIKEWDNYVDPLRKFPNVLTPEKIKELERKSHVLKDPGSLNLF